MVIAYGRVMATAPLTKPPHVEPPIGDTLFLLDPYDAAGCAQTQNADQTAKRPLTMCGDTGGYTGQVPV